MARTTTAHQFASINGVVEAPDQWQFDAFGPEEGQAMTETISGVTDVIIGRKLWQEWSEFWTGPGKDMEPFASFINAARKHVVSSTLGDALPWNSTRIDGDPVDYVARLKESGGGPISVAGGIETIRSLFLAGVVDRLMLTTHPVAVGTGRRLFDDSIDTTRLELLDSTHTSVGNVISSYGLRA